uniref:mannose-6-phosphate isomerase n=2 Tax=Trichomonas tenax TaxID=43075 RepID=A0A7H4L1D0_9EUKA|nr:mannose 6 phosphate isomerase [Trichomonas tenax]
MSLLQCQAMNYDWGKVGQSSFVYQLLENSGKTDLDSTKPFAELWIGDHDKAPSLLDNGKRLKDDERFGEINYLFKVLSVNKPLSIQVHPPKEQAVELHKIDPLNYPDENDKPEMAVAITKLSLLYGFRSFQQIKQFITQFAELAKAIGEDVANKFVEQPNSANLELLVQSLLFKPKDFIKGVAEELVLKIMKGEYHFEPSVLNAFTAINRYFPGDVGIFFPLILNVVECNPGSALYIPAGILHAYLEGDLYEAMHLSDNVVRAGMTPKFIDIKSISKTVNFVPQVPFVVEPKEEKFVKSYIPPHPVFCIEYINVPANEIATVEFKSSTCAIIQNGIASINGIISKVGNVFAIPKGQINIENKSNEPFIAVVCHSNN